ncbi:DUF3784 domain-containing protein [Clostridium tertium]
MMSIIIYSVISLLFIIIGLAVSKYKCYWLISGYNTASKVEKENMEIEEIAKHMSRMCYVISAILFLGGIITEYFNFTIIPLVIILVMIVFGYLFYLQRFDHNKKSKAETVVLVVVSFITFAILIITFSLGNEPNEIKITDSSIIIDGGYGTSIKKENIISIESIESLPEISSRTNGYSDGVNKKGDFKLENGEKIKLYVQSEDGPFIKITSKDKVVFINYKDKVETLKLLNNLK